MIEQIFFRAQRATPRGQTSSSLDCPPSRAFAGIRGLRDYGKYGERLLAHQPLISEHTHAATRRQNELRRFAIEVGLMVGIPPSRWPRTQVPQSIASAAVPAKQLPTKLCCIQFRRPRHGVPGRKPLPKVPVNHSKREARPWSRRQRSAQAPPLSLHLHTTTFSGHIVGLLCSRCRHRPELSSAGRPVLPSIIRRTMK